MLSIHVAKITILAIFLYLGSFSVNCDKKVRSPPPEINPDDLKYNGEPIQFACVYDKRQEEFHGARSNDMGSKLELIGCLDNGKGLSLYFPGLTSTISAKGTDFYNAKGWFEASDTNVCYITYAYTVQSSKETASPILEMVGTRRVEFVAREARDFVMKLKSDSSLNGSVKTLTQVTVVGLQLGAHIGSLTCKYLARKNSEMVDKLIGLDPFETSSYLDKSIIFSRAYANFAQAIFTTKHETPLRREATGYQDVYIKNSCSPHIKEEDLIVDIHTAISRKHIIAFAGNEFAMGSIQAVNGVGSININQHGKPAVPGDYDASFGVYARLRRENYGKTFTLAVTCSVYDTLTQALHTHEYKVDPVIFSCIHSSNQGAFLQARSDDLGSKLELISCLNNGKELSLYFSSITSTFKAHGPDFVNAKGWFEASNTNICYISYAYSGQISKTSKSPKSSKSLKSSKSSTSSLQKSPSFQKIKTVILKKSTWLSSSSTEKMAEERRIEFVAREAEMFVTKIKKECLQNGGVGSFKSLKQLTVVGLNLGGHIGSLTCKFLLYKVISVDERVKMLIALDPVTTFHDEKFVFRSRFAKYTQIISTMKPRKPFTLPYFHHSPVHHYVHIKNECTPKIKSENLIVDINTAVSRKQLVAIATLNGTGSMYNQIAQSSSAVPKSNEVLVGVYSEFHERDYDKVFTLSVPCGKLATLQQALGQR
ncbi:uncharacterized protein LOC116337176 isoform X2 [Contarinia nasturtii]|uniref:uncharacterized protein LOC116337176 isoform X2 n=1 Tax=Contarinia nasturtii TaxID=265458 RepID=UPI0012D48EB0|nr:uncharacterized protein LOC116337176 isoform X2 [Contarinia nasturtii]